MSCAYCKNTPTPGSEITIEVSSKGSAHCPYCLGILATEAAPVAEDARAVADRRELRRRVRDSFADRLHSAAPDGRVRCPVCEHDLNSEDERLLRGGDAFRCHRCGHDLATVAYRQEAYRSERWLPVAAALGDLRAETRCATCRYLGATAKACQTAFSRIPTCEEKPQKLVARILRQPSWTTPSCDWTSCIAVAQYRKLAGEAMLLL